MTRGREYYQQRIIDASPIDLYSATNSAALQYEYILQRPGESSPTLADTAEKYIMDSGIGDETTTREVLDEAMKRDADVVVPCDEIGDTAVTTDATIEMMHAVASEDIDMEVAVPLQSDSRLSYTEHYDEQVDTLREHGFTDCNFVLIGGIRDMEIADQIYISMKVRRHVGGDVHLHGLGCGVHRDWAVTFRRYPNLLDSVDTSTIYQHARSGKIIDQNVDTHSCQLPRGSCSTSLYVMKRELMLYLYNYLISDLVREKDAPSEASEDVERFLQRYE